MKTLPESVLRSARRRGVCFRIDLDDLVVDAPRDALNSEDLDLLRSNKSSILKQLAKERHILGMPLAEFEQEGLPIEVQVPWSLQTLWFVPLEEHVRLLSRTGVARGRVYTSAELTILTTLTWTVADSDEEVRRIATLKLALDLELEHCEDDTDAGLRPCFCCKGILFWQSIVGIKICAKCHPPGAPILAVRWIEASPSNDSKECRVTVNKESSMKISELFPSKFLRADDLDGREAECAIDNVGAEDVAGDGNDKPVLYFEGKDKGLVLNKTNSMEIASSYGDDTDKWSGKPVVLYPTKTQYQGKLVPCIRIRIPVPVAEDEPPF